MRLKAFFKNPNSLRSDSELLKNNAASHNLSSIGPPAELPGQIPSPWLLVYGVRDGSGRGCASCPSCVVSGGGPSGLRNFEMAFPCAVHTESVTCVSALKLGILLIVLEIPKLLIQNKKTK